MSPPLLGIVVPTLNEARRLPRLLEDLAELRLPHRTVVVDGGSTDGTPELARRLGAEVRVAARGRGPQLNAGAAALDTPWLLFLHADVRIPEKARHALEEWLDRARPEEIGVFRFRLAGDDRFWRFVEGVQRIRERWTGLAYGDQGLLVHRAAFAAVGGYPDVPIMEDVEIVRRLRRSRAVRTIDGALVASPRRYETEGRWRSWLRNGLLVSLHLAGVPSRLLAPFYPPRARDGRARAPSGPEIDSTVLVFARAPAPGRVKTRLARDVGPERAARIYRAVGRRVVDRLRNGPFRTVVCFDPPGAEAEVRRWLDPEGLHFRAQAPGDLGLRMAAAFDRAFRDSSRVCIVGTDAPAVDGSVVLAALRGLDDSDVVLGPATDGGYYLMALDRPRPSLFRDIPWSTPEVLRITLERASRAGLRIRLLSEETDVDTAADLETLGVDFAEEPGRSLPG